MTFFHIANTPSSVVNSRLDLIKAIQTKGQHVSMACSGIIAVAPERLVLQQLGVQVLDIPMSCAGHTTFAYLFGFVEFNAFYQTEPGFLVIASNRQGYIMKPLAISGLQESECN